MANERGTSEHATSAPTVAETDRVAALADPVARNREITRCYHELACALAVRTPGHANWCAFATWASRQAGQTIRGEDLEDALAHAFERSPALDALAVAALERARALGATAELADLRRALREGIDPAAIVARAGAAVARGNHKVFAEIGREFARFVAERGADASFDAGALEAFCRGLREGEPPEGQRYLRQAFARYYRAFFEPEAKARAELMFFANVEIGLHEQTRLQPEIRAALEAAVLDADALRARVAATLLPKRAAWLARARRVLRRWLGGPTPLDRASSELVERARGELRRAITEHVMTLTLARGERLHLGSDVPGRFPPVLARIADRELAAFLARVDPTPDSLRRTGATDWGALAERMHFIADLFRCRHESPELFDAPADPAR